MTTETKMIFVEHAVTLEGLVGIVGALETARGKALTGKQIKLVKDGVDTGRVNTTDRYGLFEFDRITAPEGAILDVVFEGDAQYASTSDTITVGAPGHYDVDPSLIEGIDDKILFIAIGIAAVLVILFVMMKR